MSDTIWVDVQGRPKDELPSDNSIMLRLKAELDGVCQGLGVATLSSFYVYSELAAQYGEAPDIASTQPSASWFDPTLALKAVEEVSAYLSRNPEKLDFSGDRRRKHWRPILVEELKRCESSLRQAVSNGCKFRFLIVP